MDLLESAGTASLNFFSTVNYGVIFALSLFPYLAFLRNIWPKDYYGMPVVSGCLGTHRLYAPTSLPSTHRCTPFFSKVPTEVEPRLSRSLFRSRPT